jgi:hypothetical protein
MVDLGLDPGEGSEIEILGVGCHLALPFFLGRARLVRA